MNTSFSISRPSLTAMAVLLLLALHTQAGWKAGSTLPDLTKQKLEGTLPDLKGKIVLVDFWASWCGPCKASFPALDQLQKEYGPRGLIILAVNQDKTKELMDRFLTEHPVGFPVVRDCEHLLVGAADVASMPSSFLFDRSGRIRYLHKGFHGSETIADYTREIEELLTGKGGAK